MKPTQRCILVCYTNTSALNAVFSVSSFIFPLDPERMVTGKELKSQPWSKDFSAELSGTLPLILQATCLNPPTAQGLALPYISSYTQSSGIHHGAIDNDKANAFGVGNASTNLKYTDKYINNKKTNRQTHKAHKQTVCGHIFRYTNMYQ